jgi:transcriptional antiterminator RfaH
MTGQLSFGASTAATTVYWRGFSMHVPEISETPHWYAVHTHPAQEARAALNLRSWRVEAFNPLFKDRRYNQFTNRPTYQIKPLFPRYIFARFIVSELLSKVSFTRGVKSVVSFGEYPTPIENEIIMLIQSQIGEDGFVSLGKQLKRGDKVVIEEGYLKHLHGVFEREVKGQSRVTILLEAVKYQGRVIVEKEYVRKIG